MPPEGTLHHSALQGEIDRLRDYFTRENVHPDTADDSGRTPLVSSGALYIIVLIESHLSACACLFQSTEKLFQFRTTIFNLAHCLTECKFYIVL